MCKYIYHLTATTNDRKCSKCRQGIFYNDMYL